MGRVLVLLCFFPTAVLGDVFWVTNSGAGTKDGSSLVDACELWSDSDCTASTGDTVCLSGEFTANVALSPSAGVIYDGLCTGATQGKLNRQGSGGSRI